MLQDAVADIGGVVECIKDVGNDLPCAFMAIAGVSLALLLSKSPLKDEATNQDNLTHVTSQMHHHIAMGPEPVLWASEADRLVGLYNWKLIIDFQIQSLIRFYRSQAKSFFQGTIDNDGWEKSLQNIKEGVKTFVSKVETATSGTGFHTLGFLEKQDVLDKLSVIFVARWRSLLPVALPKKLSGHACGTKSRDSGLLRRSSAGKWPR